MVLPRPSPLAPPDTPLSVLTLRHCNYCRLELYLLSLGKVKMLKQYPQIAWGCGDDPPQALAKPWG